MNRHTRHNRPQRPTVSPSFSTVPAASPAGIHPVPAASPAGIPRRWTDRFGLRVLRQRWNNAMPKFFRVICWSCALVSGTALAVNTAIVAGGGIPHEWWSDIYPYLLGIPAGMAFVAKFTQNYDRNGNPVNKERPTVPPSPPPPHTAPDGSAVGNTANDSDIETSQPIEIEPYNEF